MTVQIEHRLPSVSEFIALRSGVSWSVPTAVLTRQALAASLGGVIATLDGETIGMARSVGDGILNVYIQDVIVAEPCRKRGIGQKLVSALIDRMSETVPPTCLIGLFAADGQDSFYTPFGFTARPQLGFGPGMHAALSALAKSSDAA